MIDCAILSAISWGGRCSAATAAMILSVALGLIQCAAAAFRSRRASGDDLDGIHLTSSLDQSSSPS
jgi:hypothetical protein